MNRRTGKECCGTASCRNFISDASGAAKRQACIHLTVPFMIRRYRTVLRTIRDSNTLSVLFLRKTTDQSCEKYINTFGTYLFIMQYFYIHSVVNACTLRHIFFFICSNLCSYFQETTDSVWIWQVKLFL